MMVMSTQTLAEGSRLLANVLMDTLTIGSFGEPVTVGHEVVKPVDFHSEWVEQAKNHVLDPRGTKVGAGNWLQAGGVVHSVVPEGIRATRTTNAVSASYIHRGAAGMPLGFNGQTWTFSIEMRADVAQQVILGFIQNNGTVTIYGQNKNIDTEWVRYSVTATFAGSWVGQVLSVRIGMAVDSAPVGSWIEYRNAQLELSPVETTYIDGNFGDSDTVRTRWLGVADASPTVLETRTANEPIPGLVQSVTLESANEGRMTQTYSIKVGMGTELNPGDAVRVESCVQEPDLVGQLLQVDTVSRNGLAMLRKGYASIYKSVNPEGKP